MTGILAARHYADRAVQREVVVLENEPIAKDTFRLRFACPEIAAAIVPGQFVMLRLAGWDDPLIGRPLALYDRFGPPDAPEGIDVAYLVKGKFTQRLARFRPGDSLSVWGPLGNGFAPASAETLVMVAGGIGQTPFLAVTQEYAGRQRFGSPPRNVPRAKRIILCYGARTQAYFAGVEEFRRHGAEVRLATDDGSAGRKGLVTELLKDLLAELADGSKNRLANSCRIVCCGPEPMMEGVSRIAAQTGVPCEVSLETPMACGIGICFTCVARIRDGDSWDYKRTCVEGPVFESCRVEW